MQERRWQSLVCRAFDGRRMKQGGWRLLVVLGLTITGLAACAHGPDPSQIATADYGPAPSGDYRQQIRDWFAGTLIDPTSPLYTFDTPFKGYTKDSPLYGTKLEFGWVVCGTVNAKNRMGGYTGRDVFFSLFRDNRLKFVATGYDAEEACARRGR